jgi:flagellar assembly protein FliH
VTHPATKDQVVLRNVMLQPGAVFVGRARPAAAPQPSRVHGSAGPSEASAEPALARDAVLEQALSQARSEGLRLGTAEGLRQGREEGLRAGYEEGRKQAVGEAQAEALRTLETAVAEAVGPLREQEEQLRTVIASIAARSQQFWFAAEDQMVALCYEVVCRVLGEAAVTPEGLKAQLTQVTSAGDRRGEVMLYLHPSDARLLDEAVATEEPLLRPRAGIAWKADPQVALGGCIVRDADGSLDARLETVLEECRSGLLQARARRAPCRAAEAGP